MPVGVYLPRHSGIDVPCVPLLVPPGASSPPVVAAGYGEGGNHGSGEGLGVAG